MGSCQDAILALLRERGPMTYRDLSDATGITRVHLSRSMHQLERYGIVAYDREEDHQDPIVWRLA